MCLIYYHQRTQKNKINFNTLSLISANVLYIVHPASTSTNVLLHLQLICMHSETGNVCWWMYMKIIKIRAYNIFIFHYASIFFQDSRKRIHKKKHIYYYCRIITTYHTNVDAFIPTGCVLFFIFIVLILMITIMLMILERKERKKNKNKCWLKKKSTTKRYWHIYMYKVYTNKIQIFISKFFRFMTIKESIYESLYVI